MPKGICCIVENGKRIEIVAKLLVEKDLCFRQRFPTHRPSDILNSLLNHFTTRQRLPLGIDRPNAQDVPLLNK